MDIQIESNNDNLPNPIDEQRAKIDKILNIGDKKPKMILRIQGARPNISAICRVVFRQLVFIYNYNFKPIDIISEKAEAAVNSK